MGVKGCLEFFRNSSDMVAGPFPDNDDDDENDDGNHLNDPVADITY